MKIQLTFKLSKSLLLGLSDLTCYMAEQEVEILRSYELRLVRCTLVCPPSDALPQCGSSENRSFSHHNCLHSHINGLLNFIESGNYLGALSSAAARLVLDSSGLDPADFAESADKFYSELLGRVESFVVNDCKDDEDKACRVILVMCIAIAALFWFTQCNLTGPLDELPKCPLPFKVSERRELEEWESWARNQLMSAGSDLLGKFYNLQYIVFAKMLLMKMRDVLFETTITYTYGVRSISWWLVRLLFVHQRVLDERSSSLFDLIQVFMGETLHHFGSSEKVTSYWGSQLKGEEVFSIVSIAHLEAGVFEHIYGRVDSCRLHFESAEAASGLQLSVTGVLGFRTVHQVEPKAQMVLVANTNSSNRDDNCSAGNPGPQTLKSGGDDDSDIYFTPKLLGNNDESGARGLCNQYGGGNVPLKPIQQAVILAQCLLIEKSTRHDEMQRWEMAPYIEAIDSQELNYFALRCFCEILRIRWESARSRTKGRALEMMDKLVEGVRKTNPGVAQRISFCYAVHTPTVPALKKEYGELLVSCGLIGEAITLFESLELWDNLIYCNCLLGKKAAAVELIKARLSELPDNPRLWCSLGDVTNNDACYEKALEVSDNKSARAKRSLARSAYNRGDYVTSKILWESAMALNSLYPDGWFALGAAALKARDTEKAIDGFTRAVQLDPENGEAWNNIACLHMIKKKSKESFIAFKEALKFKRNSWQLWENYSHVAVDVGNISQALEAIQMVLNLTNYKRIDVELLQRILVYLERRTSARESTTPAEIETNTSTNQACPGDARVDSVCGSAYTEDSSSRESEYLVGLLGKVLQQIVRNESTEDIWGLYARWHKMKGDLRMCCEALLKQVRSYQGSDLWKDKDRFKRFAHASLDLCKVYIEISSTAGSHRELFAAEMHLKNIIKQAESFSDMEEFRDLQACLDEVKLKLQSNSSST